MFKNTKIYNQDLITKAEKKTFKNKDSFSVMQIAAKACSKYILSNFKPKRVLILCGPGNNGGDGILIAKDLLEQKCHVSIFAPLGYGKSKDSAKALTKLNNNDLFKKSKCCNYFNINSFGILFIISNILKNKLPWSLSLKPWTLFRKFLFEIPAFEKGWHGKPASRIS